MVLNGAANRDPRQLRVPGRVPTSTAPTPASTSPSATASTPARAPRSPAPRAASAIERFLDRMRDIRISEAEHGPPAPGATSTCRPTSCAGSRDCTSSGRRTLHVDWRITTMIMSIVRHPIRAKYADEWPELAAEFTTAPCRARQHLLRLVPQRRRPQRLPAGRDVRRQGRRRCPRELGPLQSGDEPDGTRHSGMPEVVHVDVPGEGWSAMAEVQDATGRGITVASPPTMVRSPDRAD